MGKGSKPRPVDRDKFNVNFDKIFKDKKKSAANQENHSKD
jgi:hypothetical protein|tara:strand:+ start:137 stop:256 length:120 start_codon:yes stop_codon:yes gene_type:complete